MPALSPSAHIALRRWALVLAFLAWCWARSVLTPWAADREPRLWLYDVLFYLGFALLAWGVAELLRCAWDARHRCRSVRSPLVVLLLSAALAAWWTHAEGALRLQLRLSEGALQRIVAAGYDDRRQRAGWFLVDSVRTPCGDTQPWLWLGRPHGGGSGINRALVQGGASVPATPQRDAYVFRLLHDGWWMAYQHARRDLAREDAPGRCADGLGVPSHRRGMAWIDDGRGN